MYRKLELSLVELLYILKGLDLLADKIGEDIEIDSELFIELAEKIQKSI